MPLRVPVVSSQFDRAEQLHDDLHSCKIVYEYPPSQPDISALEICVETRDEEDPNLPDRDQLNRNEIRQLRAQFEKIFGQINRRRTLRLIITARLMVPRTYVPDEEKPPTIKRMALVWPTITSVQSLELTIDGAIPQPVDTVIYNPEKGHLEWKNIPLRRQKGDSESFDTYQSAAMHLLIEQPGELYKENRLDGQVELKLPGCLLSGLKAICGRWHGGAYRRSPRWC